MLTSSFRSEDGVDVEVTDGTAPESVDQGSHETVEGKQEPSEQGSQDSPPEKKYGEPGGTQKGDDAPKDKADKPYGFDRVQRRFDRLKRNHQAKIQKRDARIAALQEDLDKANAEIERLKKLGENGKVPEDQLIDARVDARTAQRELDRERAAKDEDRVENLREMIAERISTLYPTEKARSVYSEAIAMGKRNGAFDSAMKDAVVREFITDSDLGPKLTEHFCRKPEVLNRLLSMSDERRRHELFAMEARLDAFLRSGGKKTAKKENQQPDGKANQAPAIGKQANRGPANKVNADFESDDDVFAFVRGNR